MTIPGPLGRKSKILDTSKVSVRLELTGINRLLCEVTGAESGCEYAFYVMKDNEVIDKNPIRETIVMCIGRRIRAFIP